MRKEHINGSPHIPVRRIVGQTHICHSIDIRREGLNEADPK